MTKHSPSIKYVIIAKSCKKSNVSILEIENLISEKKECLRKIFVLEKDLERSTKQLRLEEYDKILKLYLNYTETERRIIEDYFVKSDSIEKIRLKYFFSHREMTNLLNSFSEIVLRLLVKEV